MQEKTSIVDTHIVHGANDRKTKWNEKVQMKRKTSKLKNCMECIVYVRDRANEMPGFSHPDVYHVVMRFYRL